MKFLRILGVATAVLMTTAVARQATETPVTAQDASAAASAAAAPATPATPVNPPLATGTDEAVNAIDPATGPDSTPSVASATADNRPAKRGDVKLGQTKAGVCAACHGVDGNSADPLNPKLAGQHEHYIWRQLKLYKSGERQHPIMQAMAAPLSEQDMRDIGAYFATQRALPGVADDTPIATGPSAGDKFYQVGERIFRAGKPAAGVPACLACHGPAGRGNPGPSYPALGGQHAGYTAAQLKFFREGGVWGADKNANTTMTEVARNLSDEEIQSLASYIQGLHSTSAAATAKAR